MPLQIIKETISDQVVTPRRDEDLKQRQFNCVKGTRQKGMNHEYFRTVTKIIAPFVTKPCG